jgi:hypothetical protein
MKLEDYKDTKTLVHFNSEQEYLGLLKDLIHIFSGWDSRYKSRRKRLEDIEDGNVYIDMVGDCLLKESDARNANFDDYVILEASELFLSEHLINFYYINKDGIKTNKVAKNLVT